MKQLKHITTIILTVIVLTSMLKPDSANAATGDTTIVNGFSGLLHQNCNTGKGTFLFPSDSLSYYRILLKYKLTCPGFGCDIYDRIATLKVERETGEVDSTLTAFPSFTVDGNIVDTIQYMTLPSYSYSYDTTTSSIDSVENPTFVVSFYSDSLNPATVTYQVTVWPAYYNNYVFDSLGNATDSVFVNPDVTLYLEYDSFYVNFNVKEQIEIARAVTPYGMAVDLWYDVTDYRTLLQDSVTFVSNVCGYSNGWLVTNEFYFIEGTPPMDAFKITNLWNGTWQYGNAADPIENHLSMISIPVDTNTVYEKIRLITTGHGFGGYPNQNVAEFFDVTHTLNIAGTDFDQRIWRADCGSNPLYPQGAPGYTSTWFYKRANWCPGSYVTPQDYNATPFISPGGTLAVDYNMVPYTVTGGPSGFYHPEYAIQSHAIEYKAINYTNNASIERIAAPTNAYEYRRRNPGCDGLEPQIVIKNNGSATLTSLNIHYFVDNGSVQSYVWTGSLNLMDSTTVTLPAITFGSGNHTFTAYIDQPNSNNDEYLFDDTLRSSFNPVNIYNTNFLRILTKTDSSPEEVSWTVKDAQGTVLFSRNNFTSPLTLYTDTIYLSDGCYSVTVYDTYGDGICCYNGNGYFRIYNGSAATIITNVADYGDFYNVNLGIDFQVGVEELESSELFIYPNPTTGIIKINSNILNSQFSVKLFDLTGQVVLKKEGDISAYFSQLDISELSNGLYIIQFDLNGRLINKRVLVNK
ncbi:MAG: T9SS type A sorting domain-containing protein [Bacteroidetes bacterium]|nr:T9SS type A sorting domain-containing protein [Bacteroidota bacterium]MBP6428167.1 T9SS type A sorting domain-containing protein [Bacteroidia bacterium]